MQFGRAIRKRRMELGISQEGLAAKAGMNRTYVGDVERGNRNISLINIQKLVEGLDMSLASFIKKYPLE